MDEIINSELDQVDNQTYPDPLLLYESELAKKQRKIETIKRVLAPYIMPKKVEKIAQVNNSYLLNYGQMKPSMLLDEMSKLLSEGVEITTVLLETSDVLREVTKSSVVTVYMVDESLEEIYQIDRNLEDRKNAISYKIELGSTVAAHVAYNKEYVIVNDILEDSRFPDGVGSQEITVKSVLCVPVMTPGKDCLAIFELYRNMDTNVYDELDLRLLIVLTAWIGSALFQNQQRLNLQRQHELNDYMLKMTSCYFNNILLFDKLISEIVNFAKTSLQAEHAMFFVLKKKFDEKTADLYEEEIDAHPKKMIKKSVKIDLNKDFRLIDDVSKQSHLVNIKNAYKDRRINTMDRRRGYVIRCLLLLPIVLGTETIGVFQLINKKHATCFTKDDELLFESFSIYCSLTLGYSLANEKARSTNHLNTIYLDMMGHHVQPCIHDAAYYEQTRLYSLPPQINQFNFYPPKDHDMKLPNYVVAMFHDLACDISPDENIAIRFVLSVKKSYRDNPYHNFGHAFNVCHCMYNILRRNMEMFSKIEVKALLLASLCHDLDHIGLTNNYLDITNHPLARLYKESPLENHHVNVTRFLIRHYKLLEAYSDEDSASMMDEIREAIMATDLSDYFMKRGMLNHIIAQNNFDWKDKIHRWLVKSLMMTVADLSGQCKPFNTAKSLAKHVYEEFYNEGDKEKRIKLSPLSIMDREKKQAIHDDQIQFLNIVVLPCILLLTKFFPNCTDLYKEALEVRNSWEIESKNPDRDIEDDVEDLSEAGRLMKFDIDDEMQDDMDDIDD